MTAAEATYRAGLTNAALAIHAEMDAAEQRAAAAIVRGHHNAAAAADSHRAGLELALRLLQTHLGMVGICPPVPHPLPPSSTEAAS